MKHMDVSVIIINYNTPNLVLDCIKSVFTNTCKVTYEIIVVDNNSEEESKRILSCEGNIKYIYNQSNVGFGAANNIASKIARGRYLLFLNSDTVVTGNVIKSLYDFLETEKTIAACGTILLTLQGRDMHSFGTFPTILTECFKSLRHKENHNINNHNYKIVDYITGADLFIRKNIFFEIGGFDEDFFMYYEETDLQKRMHKKGYRVALFNKREIIHLEGSSFNFSGKVPIKRLIMQQESRFLYMKKHSSYLVYLIFRFLYAIVNMPVAITFNCERELKVKYLKEMVA